MCVCVCVCVYTLACQYDFMLTCEKHVAVSNLHFGVGLRLIDRNL